MSATTRKLVGGSIATGIGTTWHYEYTIDQMLHHFDAETLAECLEALDAVRTRSPRVIDTKIFEGGRLRDAQELAA